MSALLSMAQHELGKREAFRAHYGNDRTCDAARRDPRAGKHKHWRRARFDEDVVQCVACGKAWHRPEAQE